MFIRCKIELSQGSNSVELELLPPQTGAFTEGMSFWGQYKSAGGNIPEERRGWLFALTAWELRLIETPSNGVGMGGGGLEYAELAPLEPVAFLSNACMTDRGIEPLVRGGAAQGRLESGFAINVSLNKGPISWRLSGYKIEGASAWQSP